MHNLRLGFIVFVAVVLLALAMLLKPFTVVDAGNVGVRVTMGSVDAVKLDEGFHVISPIAKVIELSVRAQKVTLETNASSRDLQTVIMAATIGYHLNPDKAPVFYQKFNKDFEAVIVQPAVSEVLKAVVAKYSAEELISKREEISTRVRADLMQRITARAYGSIVVDEVNLTNFQFSKTFSDAVEQKQEAAQRAEKAKNDLTRIQVEGEQAVATAKAQAESLRVQREAVTTQLLELKKIENEKAAIAKWDGKLPANTGGAVPFINVGK